MGRATDGTYLFKSWDGSSALNGVWVSPHSNVPFIGEPSLAVPPNSTRVDVVGLTPGDASSVAPRGIPVGATAAPGPMPSGDVMPSGGPGEICPKAEPHPKRTAAVVVIAKRVIVFDFV